MLSSAVLVGPSCLGMSYLGTVIAAGFVLCIGVMTLCGVPCCKVHMAVLGLLSPIEFAHSNCDQGWREILLVLHLSLSSGQSHSCCDPVAISLFFRGFLPRDSQRA